MRTRALVAAATVLVALAGCSGSVSVGGKDVSGSKLAKQVAPLVEEDTGTAPDDVTCEQLEAEVGATTTCTLTLDGDTYDLEVTATDVDGSDVELDVELEDPPAASTTTGPGTTEGTTEPATTETTGGPDAGAAVAPDELEAQVVAGLEAEVGRAPEDVTCDEPLDGVVGTTGTCVLTDSGERYEVTVTVTAVDGLDVSFDFEVGTEPLP